MYRSRGSTPWIVLTRHRCCIDKTSSAELTEAINSMYAWYIRAAVCYVYFADVPPSSNTEHMATQLRDSRWFTRGWTLQELIAPREMLFFASDWSYIAAKQEVLPLLSRITNIDIDVLKTGDLSEASVAKKMSWAATRKTSRGEDMAYCLLGMFNVNMPLLYGEGPVKAFRRLQEAIMRLTHDQSLFAWGDFVTNFSIIPTSALSGPWQAPQPQYGLFADSPADFRQSGSIVPVDHGYAHVIDRARPPTVLHGGALVNLVVYKTRPCVRHWDSPRFAWQDEVEIVVLMVHPHADSNAHLIALTLYPWGDGYYSRSREICSLKLFVSQYRFEARTQQRHVLPARPFELVHGDIFFRTWAVDLESAGFERPMLSSGPAWRMKWRDRVLRISSRGAGHEEARYRFKIEEGRYMSIALHRTPVSKEDPFALGSLEVEVVPHFIAGELSFPNRFSADYHQTASVTGKFRHRMLLPEDEWRVVPEGGLQLAVVSKREMLANGGSIDLLDLSLKRIGPQR